MSNSNETVTDMVENSLLTLTYYETFRDPEKSAELNETLVKVLDLTKISKGSFSLFHLLIDQYCLETGKTVDETVQLLRGRLLGLL